ncbi:MAG: beta-N-acetylhexosaminidase [Treponema sp.]|nr:beta-N-acetylhexosaminidase [Treponema sp.]MCL2250756.1 beta-N-acetylhexosaminidase [Treponema sp.]
MFIIFKRLFDKRIKSKVSIIPKPIFYVKTMGMFKLVSKSKIIVTADDNEIQNEVKQNIAEYLANILSASTGFNFEIVLIDKTDLSNYLSNNIILCIDKKESFLDEAYIINIDKKCINITACEPAGLFRGVQTLRQLFSESIESKSLVKDRKWKIACCKIIDGPAYEYRGLMLDVARHFFNKEAVMRQIDHASLYKINKLHLHLTDDQGWRIEIKSRPALTEIGSLGSAYGTNPGGFFTQEDFIKIAEYAAKRYIEVIPEIDMPGHMNAALASIPELNPDGKLAKPRTDTKVGVSTLMCHSDATFKFLEDVIKEIAAISPSKYFHIGGDEADVTTLSEYSYFFERLIPIVKKYGKTTIGWRPYDCTDAVDGDAVVQNWFLIQDGFYFIKNKKLKTILSPAVAYLDQKYNKNTRIGFKWRGLISLEKSYDWYPSKISPATDILGIESALWTETIVTEDDIDYMLYPRLLANAEAGWTAENLRDFSDFKKRLKKHFARLDVLGVKYCDDYN